MPSPPGPQLPRAIETPPVTESCPWARVCPVCTPAAGHLSGFLALTCPSWLKPASWLLPALPSLSLHISGLSSPLGHLPAPSHGDSAQLSSARGPGCLMSPLHCALSCPFRVAGEVPTCSDAHLLPCSPPVCLTPEFCSSCLLEPFHDCCENSIQRTEQLWFHKGKAFNRTYQRNHMNVLKRKTEGDQFHCVKTPVDISTSRIQLPAFQSHSTSRLCRPAS